MHKSPSMSYWLFFIALVTTSTAYASQESPYDPCGLLRVSSNLYQEVFNDIQGSSIPINPMMAITMEAPVEEDQGGPSNNNTPPSKKAKQNQPIKSGLSDDDKMSVNKYLFPKSNPNSAKNKAINGKLNIEMLSNILRTLQESGPLTIINLREYVPEKVGRKLNMRCHRYKNKGFIQYNVDEGTYAITHKGVYLLEQIEKYYNPVADDYPKKRNMEMDDNSRTKKKNRAVPPAPSKKQKKSEEKNKDAFNIENLKRPEFHLAILDSMGEPGNYIDADDMYNGLKNQKTGKPLISKKSNFTNYYLKEYLNREWIKTKRIEISSKSPDRYTITQKGLRVKSQLEKMKFLEELSLETDHEEESGDSSSSGYIPNKKKRTRESSSSDDLPSGEDNNSEQESNLAEQHPKEQEIVSKSAEAETMKRSKKSTLENSNSAQKQESSDKQSLALQTSPPPIVNNEEGNVLEKNDIQPKLTLDELPMALQDHLLTQIVQKQEGYLNGLQQTVMQHIHEQMEASLSQMFDTGPGITLKKYLEEHITITITRK